MALDEIGSGRADGDNEIKRPTGIKGEKIFYKRSFRILIILRGIQQRVVEEVHWLVPLLAYLGANGLRVVAPGFEAGAKRMQHHHPLGFWVSCLTLTRHRQQ